MPERSSQARQAAPRRPGSDWPDPTPISALPLRDHVHARLQELLISRALGPGDHLVEERLAAQLGVSRGPVREALQRLHRDGWVTLRPRHGAFVARPGPQEVQEFFEAREVVEGAAAALAARRCTPADAEALLRICDTADEGLRTGETPERLAVLTAHFHRTVLQIARNHLLLDLGEQLSQRSRWFFAPLVRTLAPQAWTEHRAVAELIGAGRAEAASAAMSAHVTESRDAYLATQPVDPAQPPPPRRTRTARPVPASRS